MSEPTRSIRPSCSTSGPRDALYLRGTGGDYLPLEPTGKDLFFYRQLYVKVGFKRDKTGKIEALLWNGDYPCKKLSDKASQ